MLLVGVACTGSASSPSDAECFQRTSGGCHSMTALQVFLAPVAGFQPPAGCNCVAGDGITSACANHRSMSPPPLNS